MTRRAASEGKVRRVHKGTPGTRFLIGGSFREPEPEWRTDFDEAEEGEAAVARLQWRMARATLEEYGPEAGPLVASVVAQSIVSVNDKLSGRSWLQVRDVPRWLGLLSGRGDVADGVLAEKLPAEWKQVLGAPVELPPLGALADVEVNWDEVCEGLKKKVLSERAQWITSGAVATALAESVAGAGAPATRITVEEHLDLGPHVAARRGSFTTLLVPLVAIEDSGRRPLPANLRDIYERLGAAGAAPVDMVMIFLVSSRGMRDQLIGLAGIDSLDRGVVRLIVDSREWQRLEVARSAPEQRLDLIGRSRDDSVAVHGFVLTRQD